MNAINEIAQWTSEIRHKPGKDLLIPDLLSRPFGKAYLVETDEDTPAYIPPETTMAALEQTAMNVISPSALALAQKNCPDFLRHNAGNHPKGVKMGEVQLFGETIHCEISDEKNPRPLVPKEHRDLVLNLFHHLDHPSARETVRRTAQEYYWPRLKTNAEAFVHTCHPCQVAKQSPSVKAGTGFFPVPDQRFSVVHLDVVGPLPPSEGCRFLLSVFDRTSRWIECYPMRSATSADCAKAFMEFVSRFGTPAVAVSDNGNSFTSNLYKDIMKSFNIKVNFTPAYHPASNGAVERRHQTIKNSLKAALVDMNNAHQDKWMRALPWVLLGKRIQVQPDLDTSAASLVYGKQLSVPGQLLGVPGPPLSNIQTKSLLEELYKMSAKPAIQTSATVDPIDTSFTDTATHVYIKVDEPRGLSPRWEGPYLITSRPSRSQIEVRLGSYVDGSERKQIYNWNTCKIAHLRPDSVEASRPKLGRPSGPHHGPTPTNAQSVPNSNMADNDSLSNTKVNKPTNIKPAKIQKPLAPLITDRMFAQWSPEIFKAAGSPDFVGTSSRPVRTTRNPDPKYVDAINGHFSLAVRA